MTYHISCRRYFYGFRNENYLLRDKYSGEPETFATRDHAEERIDTLVQEPYFLEACEVGRPLYCAIVTSEDGQ